MSDHTEVDTFDYSVWTDEMVGENWRLYLFATEQEAERFIATTQADVMSVAKRRSGRTLVGGPTGMRVSHPWQLWERCDTPPGTGDTDV